MAPLIPCIVAALAAGAAAAQPAWQPEKIVEFVVPTGAGANSDRVTRLAQAILQERKLVAMPMVVVNRAGGGQALAVSYLGQRPSDPHCILFINPSIFANELSGVSQQRYGDFTPLALLQVETTALTVRAGSRFRDLRDLVAAMKADPGSVSFAMPSRGGGPHLTLAAAMKAAGLDPRQLKIVVFKGSNESMTAMLGGHVDVMVASVGSVLGQVQSGGARILGIGAAQRLPGLGGAPTFREQGVDSTGVAAWRGFFGAHGLTPAQVAFWDEAFARMVATPEWKKNVDDDGVSTQMFLRSREFGKYLDAEYAATRSVMSDIGLLK